MCKDVKITVHPDIDNYDSVETHRSVTNRYVLVVNLQNNSLLRRTANFVSRALQLFKVVVNNYSIRVWQLPGNPYMFRYALKKCARIFAISDYTRTKLVQEFDVPENKVITNRLFIDCNTFDDNRSTVTVLMVARFDKRKGHRYLLEAAKLLQERNVRFVIIGYGPLDTKQMVVDYGLEDSVIVFPRMSQKNRHIVRHLHSPRNIDTLLSLFEASSKC